MLAKVTTLGVSPAVAETIQKRKGAGSVDSFLRILLKLPTRTVRRGRPPTIARKEKDHGATRKAKKSH